MAALVPTHPAETGLLATHIAAWFCAQTTSHKGIALGFSSTNVREVHL